METKQETKSLPRNRKCGNCRYFEPAPLWRKGWCRNPRLYDRRANHLVDAATIDCEQVFRARIYWEPVPTTEVAEINGYNPAAGNNANPSADSGLVDAGVNRGRVPSDGILRPRGTAVQNNPAQTNGMPVITRREKADASPGVVAKPSQTRRWLVENIPYYDKIDGPISRINLIRILPWVVIIAFALFIVLNVLGPKKDTPTTARVQGGTVTAGVNTTGNATPSVVAATQAQPTVAGKPLVPPTVTISNLVPTSTPTPPTPVNTQAAATQARVTGTDGVNLRKEPGTGTASTILTKIAPGKLVTIRSADRRTIEGGVWWPVSYNGQDGWILSTFLEAVPAS
jgi:hypothetical protein